MTSSSTNTNRHPSEIFHFKGFPPLAAAWSPGGGRIAFGMQQEHIQILDGRTHQTLRVLHIPTPVAALAWEPAGKRLAATGPDHTVWVWDTMSGDCIEQYVGHQRGLYQRRQQQVTALAWSPDGQQLASGSSDGTIDIWNARSAAHCGCLTGPFPAAEPVAALRWVSSSRLISVARASCTRLAIWQDRRKVVEREVASEVVAFTSVPDDGKIIFGLADGSLHLWNQEAGTFRLDSLATIEGRILALIWKDVLQVLSIQLDVVAQQAVGVEI